MTSPLGSRTGRGDLAPPAGWTHACEARTVCRDTGSGIRPNARGNHDGVVLPEPRDHREGRVVAAVFTLLREACRWPTFEVLDRFLDGQGEPDAEGLLAGMPLGLVHGAGPNSRPIRDDQEIGLTVAGLASVDAASEDVGLFLDLVRLAADLESAGLSGAPVPILTAEIAEQRLQLPAAGRADLLARAGAVLATESWAGPAMMLGPGTGRGRSRSTGGSGRSEDSARLWTTGASPILSRGRLVVSRRSRRLFPPARWATTGPGLGCCTPTLPPWWSPAWR